MQSRISLCNGTLLRKNLTRFWPVWSLYLVVWLLVMPLNLYTTGQYGRELSDVQSYIFSVGLMGGSVINLLYAIVVAMCLFSPFYGSRSVNTVAALPVRRENYFLTQVTTGLLVALVPNLLILAFSMIVTAATGTPCISECLQWYAIQAMVYVFFYGLSVLCACMVGNLLFLPILYGLLNFSAVVLNYIVTEILSIFVFGLSTSGTELILTPLSPLVELFTKSATKFHQIDDFTNYYTFARWDYVGILAGVGVVLILVSFALFRKRRMESAGDVIAIRPLRPVFKYCFTTGSSIVLGILASIIVFANTRNTSVVGLTACLLVGGFIGYFGAEMMLKKTFRVWGRSWIGFGVFSLCLIAVVAAMELDVTGYERRIPVVDKIQSVSIGTPYDSRDNVTITEAAYVQDITTLHQRIVAEKAELESLEKQSYNDSLYYTSLDIRYILKDGTALSRSYALTYTEVQARDPGSLISQYAAIYNDPYVEELRYTPGNGMTSANISSGYVDGYDSGDWYSANLTTAQAHTLYIDCILPDIREGKLKTQLLNTNMSKTIEGEAEEMYNISIDFSRYVPDPNSDRMKSIGYSLYLSMDSRSEAPRTMAFLQELDLVN